MKTIINKKIQKEKKKYFYLCSVQYNIWCNQTIIPAHGDLIQEIDLIKGERPESIICLKENIYNEAEH